MKPIEELRTENLWSLVTKAGTQSELASQIGRSPQQLHQWLKNSPDSKSGKPKYISSNSCRLIEKALHLPDRWMDQNHDVAKDYFDEEENSSGRLHEAPNRTVPIFERPDWTEVGQQKSPTGWIVCPVDCGEHTYALKVRDNSMLNPNGNGSFCAGDIVYIDPDEQAVDGDFVFATSSHYKMASIKQFIIQEEKEFLYTSNPSWQRQWIEIDDSIKLHGVIIAKVRNIK